MAFGAAVVDVAAAERRVDEQLVFSATLLHCSFYDQCQIQYTYGYGWLEWVPTWDAEITSVSTVLRTPCINLSTAERSI